MKLQFTKVKDVKNPVRANHDDAGIDFFIPEDFTPTSLKSNEDILIDSGIKVIVPKGYALIFKEKSGVATKKKLTLGASVVDAGYRGTIHFHLFNNGKDWDAEKNGEQLNPGDKIIQGVVVPVSLCDLELISNDDYDLDKTNRGEGGFGSTGDK